MAMKALEDEPGRTRKIKRKYITTAPTLERIHIVITGGYESCGIISTVFLVLDHIKTSPDRNPNESFAKAP